MKKKDKITESEELLKKDNTSENKGGITSARRFYSETWFILTLAIAAFAVILGILVMTAIGSGLEFKNLFNKYDGDLDYINDSLDSYINIKESDYKGYEIEIPIRKPAEAELQTKINELLAKNRGDSTEGKDTFYTGKPIAIGDDIRMSYLGYELDEAGRKLLISSASNFETANTQIDRFTVGLNYSLLGVGFESNLVGMKPNGALTSVRGSGDVLEDNVIYATVSFVLDNGLVYDEVDVCIDPTDENFERLWGIGAYEELFSTCKGKQGIGMIVLTGNSTYTLDLEGGGRITYTALTVNYVTTADTKPMTVETYYPADYTVEELQNKTIYYDVYVKDVVKYNVPTFNDAFITEKLGLTEEKLADFAGETLVEKCKSYYMKSLNDSYIEDCKAYLEVKVWQRLLSVISVTMYPDDEIDRIYVAEIEAYARELAEKNAMENGAGGTLDDYMPGVLGLEEGAEWTSYLLETVKMTVKERLIVYSVLRKEGLIPTEAEFEALYDKQIKSDYERAKLMSPGTFSSLEDYEEYINSEYGKETYVHDNVYYYYATEKLIEFVTPVYSES